MDILACNIFWFLLVSTSCPTWLSRYLFQDSGSNLNVQPYSTCLIPLVGLSWGFTDLLNATLLFLGSDRLLKSYHTYCRLYWNRSPSPYLLLGGIYLVLPLRAICRLWNTLTHGQEIPYLFTYTTSLRRPTGHLCSHKVVSLPGLQSGHRRPKLMSIPTKYPEATHDLTKLIQQMSVSGQIFPTCIDPKSFVFSRLRSSCSGAVICPNQSYPQQNIFNRRQGSDDICQVASTLLVRRRGYARLYPIYVVVPIIVCNRRRDLMNYCQPMPGLSKPAPWPLRIRLKYLLPVVLRHTRWRLSPSLWSIDQFSSFYARVNCAPLLTLK